MTNAVIEQVVEWQARLLDAVYPIVYLDCLVVKIRQDKQVINKAVYLALGVNDEGHKELLGMWISENEGAKFWLNVLTELQNRGVKDILIACVDGLKGFPDAINAVYPDIQIQLCIVHTVRNSLKFVPSKDSKAIESINSVIRKAIKKRKQFPHDDSVRKVIYLAIEQASKKWTMPIRNWKMALNRFMIEFEDRLKDVI
ncbi:hypothetical protein PAUR_b1235 [Pseudoalteromonas aurantia 208]|uniref:Mutator family transposase n=1 Tax=Pseudoalteromonas aurantia 208 TaxID=1314867 RepID=A0ABR9EJ98_9GAMM|nr:hypothetical protein [Pseudoalteromonas aurantia 208]